MSETGQGRNDIPWRVSVLEREVERIKEGQPQVVAFQVAQLAKQVEQLEREINGDMEALRRQITAGDESQAKQIRDFRRIFVGVFSALGVGVGLAVVSLILTGSP